MKKISLVIALYLLLLLLCSCGDVSGVKVLPYESEIYTDAEIDAAINVAKTYFRNNFDGCSLTEITYAGDEMSKAHQEFAERHDADEVIVLTSSFDVGPSGGDGSLNPDSTYNGWKWILVRKNEGSWNHVDHGY